MIESSDSHTGRAPSAAPACEQGSSAALPPLSVTVGDSPGHEEPIPERIGPFRILGRLGHGGMGVVYEAERERPRQTVALKLIKPGYAGEWRLKRFRLEQEILARLQHPGIARIYHADVIDTGQGPQPYFAMELVRGVPVTEFADQQKLGEPERLELIARVADAVQYAHANGVIHRDLKPANILVDDSGQPKVLDFGVARTTDSDLYGVTLQTNAGDIVGTLPYMSPEQAGGDPTQLDNRSDVYSLGVIAYELLAGHRPYELPRSLPEALRIIREADPPTLSTATAADGRPLRHLRGDVETIVEQALIKDRGKRYATAADFAGDIRRWLRHEPIMARRPTVWYQLGKFARRNRALVGGVAATMLALTAGLAGMIALYVRAENQRIRAVEAETAANEQASAAMTARAETADALEEATLQALRLAVERGDWAAVLSTADTALARGFGDPAAVRLRKVLAYDSMPRYDNALAEAESLAAEPLTDDHRASISLWLGELYIIDPERREEALDLMRRALELPLSEADRHYALALTAETMPQTAAELEAALKADHYHVRARLMLGLTYLLQGRMDEAISAFKTTSALYPRDPNAHIGLAAAYACQGRADDTSAALDSARGLVDDAVWAAVHEILSVTAGACETLQQVDYSFSPKTAGFDVFLKVGRLAIAASAVQASAEGEELAQSLSRRFPPAVSESWGRVCAAVGPARYFGSTSQTMISNLREAARRNPEGITFYFLAAAIWDGTGDLLEATELSWKAIQTPSLLPIAHYARLLHVVICSQRAAFGPPLTEEQRLRALGVLRELNDRAELSPAVAWGLAQSAVALGDKPLARWIAQCALRRDASESWPPEFIARLDRESATETASP